MFLYEVSWINTSVVGYAHICTELKLLKKFSN